MDHDGIMPSTRQNPHMAPLQLSPVLAATGTYPFVKLEESAANFLTNSAHDPSARIPEYKVCAVRLERAS